MTTTTTTVLEGIVKWDIHGTWADCSPGLYVGSDMAESAIARYRGSRVRITIEMIEMIDETEG